MKHKKSLVHQCIVGLKMEGSMPQGMCQPLGAESGPWITASKETGISVQQPQENEFYQLLSLEEDLEH